MTQWCRVLSHRLQCIAPLLIGRVSGLRQWCRVKRKSIVDLVADDHTGLCSTIVDLAGDDQSGVLEVTGVSKSDDSITKESVKTGKLAQRIVNALLSRT